ncbi:MAG: succinate dehydrogenase assembly factor 2 family protein [Gammaproteobacteria bacterium]|nr:MAG: succinate dehydrogenase assembly factor 2 family protein [Gammaproteobacteria bacterium]
MEHDLIVNHLTKLHWACRRGMLELDVLLGNFLKEAYPGLPVEEKKIFVELLECADTDLFAWLLGQEKPAEGKFAKITEAIRCHAQSRVQL